MLRKKSDTKEYMWYHSFKTAGKTNLICWSIADQGHQKPGGWEKIDWERAQENLLETCKVLCLDFLCTDLTILLTALKIYIFIVCILNIN